MEYRNDRNGVPISQLGYGCMRFTKKGAGIDMDKAEKELLTAIEQGVNYFDTAYIYPGSEEALGKILAKNNLRDKVYIATKLPQYLMRNPEAIEKTFQEELKRLQTDHVDYYLMHMFTDFKEWENIKALGIEDWIARHKADGSVRNIGFSYHGDTDMFLKILDVYDWDFCQIQYNYLDEHTQAGKRGLHYAASKGIPVIIMEPLRGGRLVKYMPDSALKIMGDFEVKRSAAEWALRWLWEQPEVTCVLSGMNSMEMLLENARVASEVKEHEFTEKEYALIDEIRDAIGKAYKIGCTGCGYCMPCPRGVNIPLTFSSYNSMYSEKKFASQTAYMMATSLKKDSSDFTKCIGCGLCEKHCPQHLEIRKELKKAGNELIPWYFKMGLKVVKKFMN